MDSGLGGGEYLPCTILATGSVSSSSSILCGVGGGCCFKNKPSETSSWYFLYFRMAVTTIEASALLSKDKVTVISGLGGGRRRSCTGTAWPGSETCKDPFTRIPTICGKGGFIFAASGSKASFFATAGRTKGKIARPRARGTGGGHASCLAFSFSASNEALATTSTTAVNGKLMDSSMSSSCRAFPSRNSQGIKLTPNLSTWMAKRWNAADPVERYT
mmetsp:Transcript_16350/g.35492  ORF Transcript_16350/g.35492 Transcript_16350/m.35492 type:complete len:217 (-) Transcript_16350:452-1102(-)